MENKISVISGFGFEQVDSSTISFKQPVTNINKSTPGSEQSDYSKISFTHGYGQLSKVGATVQKGVKGYVDISLSITTFSDEFYHAVTKEVSKFLDRETTQKLNESTNSNNHSDWWCAIFAGGSNSHNDYQHYKDAKDGVVEFNNSKITDSITENIKGSRQEYKVNGHFDIVGTSNIPTTVYLFIETLTITTADGSTTLVVNSEPVVADAQGNTGKAETSGKLNIIPLG